MQKILISKCLLGNNVRYDGGHCAVENSKFKKLKEKFDFIEICPEMMAGLGVPRESMELNGQQIITRSGVDITPKFIEVKNNIKSLVQEHKIQYALLKEKSPSCGVHNIYDGSFTGKLIAGQGIITQLLLELGIKIYSENDINELILL